MYEVYDKDITANSTAKLSSLTADGGLWGVKVGNVNSLNDSYSWLRSGNPIVYYSSCLLGTSGIPIVSVGVSFSLFFMCVIVSAHARFFAVFGAGCGFA